MKPNAAVSPLVAALVIAVGVAAPPSVQADDVYLANGQVFEGVVTRWDGDTLRIRMGHGEMGLPASWVERVETADSPLAAYLERRAKLSPDGSAAEWLDLAVWARDRDLAEGAREAGLRAASLDPRLAGLGAVLQPAGFTFDAESGDWLTEAQLMARRGYVRVEDQWLPAEVVAERARQDREERAARAEEEREANLERAITLLALSQLEEQTAAAARPEPTVVASPYGVSGVAGIGVGSYVGYAPVAVAPRGHRGDGHRTPRRRAAPIHPPRDQSSTFGYDALAGRQPGSIIPIATDPGAARVSSSQSSSGDRD